MVICLGMTRLDLFNLQTVHQIQRGRSAQCYTYYEESMVANMDKFLPDVLVDVWSFFAPLR